MKKTGLFKIIMYVLLGIVVMTWIVSASYFSEGELADMGMYSIGFFDYFQLIFSSFAFSYFIQILIILVSVGALYGVLIKTGKYRALIDRIANNLRGLEFIFLIGIAVTIALITSIFDYGFALFIFLPFVIEIILTMGYDKITACLATFGAMLIGTIGSTLGYNTTGTITGILDVDLTTGMIFKLVLLVLSIATLIVFLTRAKRVKKGNVEETSKKTIALSKNKKTKEVVENDEDNETLFIGEKISNKYSVFPIILILSLILVILVLGCTKWSNVFGVDIFTKANDAINNFTVKIPQFTLTTEGFETSKEEVAIFSKLLGENVAFGEWYYSDMAIVCLIAALVLGLSYRMKLKEIFSNMANGAMKMLKPALLVMFVYTVIYFAANAMFFPTIIEHLLNIGKGFNLFFNTIVTVLGSALHVDILYVANYMLPQMAAQEVSATVLILLVQSLYGVTMFVSPTSAVLALGLSYLGISYKEWIKKIWPLALILFVISIIINIVALLVI
ncbi:MAG: hypothetical protein ACI33S_02250 [Bacilli bacterium]